MYLHQPPASFTAGPPVVARMAKRAVPLATAAAALVLVCQIAGPALAAAGPDEVRGAVGGVFSAGDYQRTLPLPTGSGSDGQDESELWSNPDWWRDEGDAQAPDVYRPGIRESEGYHFELPPAVAKILKVLMWVVFLVGGAVVAFYLANEARLFSRWRKGRTDVGAADAAAAADGADGGEGSRLDDYESFARRGRYAEAVHLLLLRSIDSIRERGVAVSSALTSREILRHASLEEAEREALSTLVDVTEVTHFGGRDASEDDFVLCRDLFRRIAERGTG